MPSRAYFIGRTGDGKSATCITFAKNLGYSGEVQFSESDDVKAITHEPISLTVRDIEIIDTPGFVDTDDVEKDKLNFGKIVDDARARGSVNAFILVVNEQAPKFDWMNSSMLLLVDTFGPAFIVHMCILFTRAFVANPAKAKKAANSIRDNISRAIGIPISNNIPFFQTDAHPEELAKIGATPQRIANRSDEVCHEHHNLARWILNQSFLDTANAVCGGEFLEVGRKIDEDSVTENTPSRVIKHRAEQQWNIPTQLIMSSNEVELRQPDISLHSEHEPFSITADLSHPEVDQSAGNAMARTQSEDAAEVVFSQPAMMAVVEPELIPDEVSIKNVKPGVWIAYSLDKTASVKEDFYCTSILKTETENRITEIRSVTPTYSLFQRSHETWICKQMGKKRTENFTEKAHTGNVVSMKKREEQRTVDTLSSGHIEYGSWVIVREWEEK
jgi:hypothetical protein